MFSAGDIFILFEHKQKKKKGGDEKWKHEIMTANYVV